MEHLTVKWREMVVVYVHKEDENDDRGGRRFNGLGDVMC